MSSQTAVASPPVPWFRQVGRDQWRAFLATFLGWLLDGFDFTILTFVLIDIQHSFTVDRALAGALGTVTLFARLIGGVAAGTAADAWGRKRPLIFSILWFSIFACLSGFSTSYAMLFALRALFGVGMGGEWAAGMPLVLEHWPPHLRGLASGLLQGGWYWGFILSAATFQFIYPFFDGAPDLGWRVMFWVGILPALFTLWIRAKVPESPVWIERQRRLREMPREKAGMGAPPGEPGMSVMRIFRSDLIGTTTQTAILMSAFMFSYYSISYWYPTFLRESARPAFSYILALNVGAIVGMALWGQLSETRLGRRGAVALAATLGVMAIPLYLYGEGTAGLWAGALLMGSCGSGIWGMAPSYLSERFPTAARGVGLGFAYHAGAAIGAMTPALVGALQDRGMRLTDAMAVCIGISGLLVASMIWMGPETRGRHL